MNRARTHLASTLCIVALASLAGCGESREDSLKRQLGYEAAGKEKPKVELPPEVPPHPTRDALAPVLSKIYSQPKLPDVLEAEIDVPGAFHYEITPGVMSVIRLEPGLGKDEQIRSIVMGVAEADGWAYRADARRPYAELIHKIKRGYGDEQKEQILKAYADLKLMHFFNGPDAQAAVASLPGDVQGTVEAMRQQYVGSKDKVWERWMGVKMYARRVVAGQEPFRTVLRDIKKELGKEEPPPRTWEQAMDGPFQAWGTELKNNEEIISKVLNMRELKEREEYFNDTHGIWAMEGSALLPDKAKGLKSDKDTGFAIMREDLGGGYNDLTFVFSRKLSGPKLKRAYLQSLIFGSLLSDFGMLATAGSDYAERDEENRIDPQTSVVPDKYDPLYAKCGSEAAVDTLILHYRDKFPFLQGLSPNTSQAEKILDKAHKCVLDGAPEAYRPQKKDDKDVEGPAPGSRLAIYQMLARFENVDVNMAAMGSDVRTQEDDVIDEAEAVLKRIKNDQEAGKGVK